MQERTILGIDIGGSGIKGALVDIDTGRLLTERLRVDTPKPATPKAVSAAFGELVREFHYRGPIGCGFPAIIRDGTAYSAANIDKSWIGVNVEQKLSRVVEGCSLHVLNDADAAGIAEIQYGKGQGYRGTVLLITIGSGLGTALFYDNVLVPNTELGHLFMSDGQVAEKYASNQTRKDQDLDWEIWGRRFNEYLKHLERLLSPDLILLSGGVSKRFEHYASYLHVKAEISPAALLNNAGTIGSAYYAFRCVIEHG